MRYELYADILFITNFTMDCIALTITGKIIKQKIRYRWILLAGLLGTVGSMCFFFWINHYILYQLGVHFLINPLMVWVCFHSKKWKEFLMQWFFTYLAVIVLGGVMEWGMGSLVGAKYFWIFLPMALFFLVLLDQCSAAFHRQKKTVYDLLLVTSSGKLPLKGFYDTGNLLMDPMVHKPVHIIKEQSLEAIFDMNTLPVRMIPFHSLGKESGLIKAVTLEGMYILKENTSLYLEKPVFGIAKEKLFQNDNYDVILNGKSMED
ncbi:MAG: sigma-E processing peptidase SpoIIGA [Lachnospiraceae bacterium]